MRTTFKNALLRLAALATACLLLTITPALAATCTLCGSETGSADYLCTNCLLTLLHQEREDVPLEVVSAQQNADGTVTVTWTDDAAGAPYTVRYELLETAPVPFGWTAAEGVTENTFTLTRLVPGVSYIISIQDNQGQTASITYYAPVPGTDTAIGAKIRFKPMHRIGRSTKQQPAFSSSEIAQENETLHGLYLRLTYSPLATTRHYAFQIAIEAPNGFSDVVFSGTLELHHGKSSVPVWGFIPVDDFFDLLTDYYGGVPTGEYDVTLYFNGQKVYTAPFTVTE